jgi:hypothetical protein
MTIEILPPSALRLVVRNRPLRAVGSLLISNLKFQIGNRR